MERESGYHVTAEPVTWVVNGKDGPEHVPDDNWRYLVVRDATGVVVHQTYCSLKELPQEVAIAVERSMRLNMVGRFAPINRF